MLILIILYILIFNVSSNQNFIKIGTVVPETTRYKHNYIQTTNIPLMFALMRPDGLIHFRKKRYQL